MKLIYFFAFSVACLQILSVTVKAQDLDPRAYLRVPIQTTVLNTGFSMSEGDVVTDATLPIKDIKASVQAPSLSVLHSFGFLGKTSSLLVALPWSWAQVSGEVGEQLQKVERSGLADMRLRWTVLFKGAPAATLAQMDRNSRKTIIGASLNVVVPTGEFITGKLINIGTNRFAFRPELAVSQRIGRRWILDFYPGLWLFTNNHEFYPGNALREQKPLGTFQGHLSYNLSPLAWVAVNTTYYVGGTSTIAGDWKDDRQSNFRVGMTLVLPTGKFSSLKFAASTGAVVRVGQDFTTYSLGWQHTWIKGLKKRPAVPKQ